MTDHRLIAVTNANLNVEATVITITVTFDCFPINKRGALHIGDLIKKLGEVGLIGKQDQIAKGKEAAKALAGNQAFKLADEASYEVNLVHPELPSFELGGKSIKWWQANEDKLFPHPEATKPQVFSWNNSRALRITIQIQAKANRPQTTTTWDEVGRKAKNAAQMLSP